jgi:hypothetical protein
MDFPVQLEQQDQVDQQVAVQLVRKDQLEQRVQQVAVQLVHKDRRVQLVQQVFAEKLEQLELVEMRVRVARPEQSDRQKLLMFLSPLGHYKQQPGMGLQLQLVSEHLKQGSHINFRFSSGEQRIVLTPLMGWSC